VNDTGPYTPVRKQLGAIRGKRVSATVDRLVEMDLLAADRPLPLVVRPALAGVDLVAWCGEHRALVEEKLAVHGGILFRGFDSVRTPADLERAVAALSGDLLAYRYRSTPRSEVEGKIYTSTEYPADQSIPPHNEMAYSRSWPMKIWFFCAKAAERGGETPIADSRRVHQGIDPGIRAAFRDQGVMYVRNYGGGIDLPWQTVFQTEDRAEVEAFCRQAGIDLEWLDGGRLRTRQVCQGVAQHPRTGDPVWFNQAHLFHVSALAPEVRASLLKAFREDELPRNAYFGDGSPIPVEMLDAVRAVYARELVVYPWQEGDLLLLDNMLTAHARQPFEGPRRILVGMAEPAGETA